MRFSFIDVKGESQFKTHLTPSTWSHSSHTRPTDVGEPGLHLMAPGVQVTLDSGFQKERGAVLALSLCHLEPFPEALLAPRPTVVGL